MNSILLDDECDKYDFYFIDMVNILSIFLILLKISKIIIDIFFEWQYFTQLKLERFDFSW